jgi:hypothetical protein
VVAVSLLEMLLPAGRARVAVGRPVRPGGPWLVMVDGVASVEVSERERLLGEFERLRLLYPGVRVRAASASEVRP